MESHPEEFNLHGGKWGELFSHIKERVVDEEQNRLVILSNYECEMLWGKFVKAGQKQLHKYVMRRIFDVDEKKE
jgi:hypothetical protein